jgi:hypothetical protein
MALRSSLAGQIGYVAETTYGTRVVPTRFLELEDDSLSFDIGRDEAHGLRASSGTASGRIQRTDRVTAGKKSGGGSVTHLIGNKGMGLLFKHALGAVTITSPTTLSRKHAHTLADPFGLSLTTQVGRPDVGGTVRVFEYEGCAVTGWEIVQELDDYARWTMDLDAEDETTSQSLAAASFPASESKFHWTQLVVSVGGSAVNCQRYRIRGETALKTDRYFVGSALKKQPILNAMTQITGEFDMELEDLTQYGRYTGLTQGVAVVATWTGAIIDGAQPFSLVVTVDEARFDGATPNLDGDGDVISYTIPFTANYDGSAEPLLLDFYTTDAAS